MKEKLKKIFTTEKDLAIFTAIIVLGTAVFAFIPFAIYLAVVLLCYPVILICVITYFLLTKQKELAKIYGLSLLVYISLSIIISIIFSFVTMVSIMFFSAI